MTDRDMIIKLHDTARRLDSIELRKIADRFAELIKISESIRNLENH